jgi:hypothetical protein
MKRYLILLLMLLPAAALAQATHGFTFGWVDPVQRVDGQPLNPATELQAYRLRCDGAESVERFVDRAATDDAGNGERQYEWVAAVQQGGWYDCRMTAVDTDNLESDWSETVSLRKLAQPNPPGLRRGR